MNALLLAALLLAEPTDGALDALAPTPEAIAVAPVARPLVVPSPIIDADARPERGLFRVTLGGGGVSGMAGVSPTVLVGLEINPWRHVGLRGGMGMVAATGGGAWSSAELSAAVVYHALPGAFLDPWIAAGAQFGVLSLYRESGGPPRASFATNGGGAIPPPDSVSGRGPVNSYASPEVQVGVNTRLRGRLSLDVGVRYLSLTYKGDTRNAFSGLVTLCTPF